MQDAGAICRSVSRWPRLGTAGPGVCRGRVALSQRPAGGVHQAARRRILEPRKHMERKWIALGLALVAVVGCAEPVQMRKHRMINAIRHALLESIEAEKSAVLATTDEESQSLAAETQRFAAEINRILGELHSLIGADARPEETQALDTFDAAWAELENVDRRLLALAVANTNLKASRLSAREGASALDSFVTRLDELEDATADPETIRGLSRASVAALRLHALLLVHIPTAGDAEMTRLEKQMDALDEEVDRNLARARDGGQLEPQQVALAAQAWVGYRRVLADVLRLSRENTNVISFEVSVHEKRHVTKDCLAALSALERAVDLGGRATR